MSYSSLYGIKNDFTGEEVKEYTNSWWFSPIVYRILPDKYIPDVIATPYGYKKSIIGMGGNEIWKATNDKVNDCKSFADRVCWELSNQNAFYTKDKKIIADAIRQFVSQNDSYDKDNEDGISPLKSEHIIERFNEIANDIESLDENEYPFFIFKNTSVDDEVEYWFREYDEDSDDYVSKSLKDWDKYLTAFVLIKDGAITGFVPNTDFNYSEVNA